MKVVKKTYEADEKIPDEVLVVKFHDLIKEKETGQPKIKEGEFKGQPYRKIFARVQVVEGDHIGVFVPMSLAWKGLEWGGDLGTTPELHIHEDAAWHPAWIKAARAMGVDIISDGDFDHTSDDYTFLLMLERKLKDAQRFFQVRTNPTNDKGEGGGWVMSDSISALASGYEKHVRAEYEKAKADGVFDKKSDDSLDEGDPGTPHERWGEWFVEVISFLSYSDCTVKIGESGQPLEPETIIRELRKINQYDKFTDVPLVSLPLWADLIKRGIVGEFDEPTLETIWAKMPKVSKQDTTQSSML